VPVPGKTVCLFVTWRGDVPGNVVATLGVETELPKPSAPKATGEHANALKNQ
jgi:hypothetical protein